MGARERGLEPKSSSHALEFRQLRKRGDEQVKSGVVLARDSVRGSHTL